MTSDKPSNRQKKKRKNRRKKSSKCTPTSNFAIEKSPFKDNEDTCIKIELERSTVHIFDRKQEDKITALKVLKNIVNMDVGVNLRSLMNDELYLHTDLQLLTAELKKLLKKHSRLNVYGRVACERMLLVYPAARGQQRFSCKEAFHSVYFIVRHILPKSLLGSKHNFKTFMKSVRRIVYGNLHQCLGLSSVVHGLKVGHITWLQSGLPSHSLRLSVLSRLVKWLLLYVQHIIKAVWHVAVSTSKELVYCDKLQWSELVKAEVKALLSNRKIRIVTDDPKDLQNIVNLGKTDFLIKKQGLRPITIFRQPTDVDSVELRKDARTLLQQWAYFSECTNSMFSPGMEHLLHQGLMKIRKCHPDPACRPKYYFVRADVKDAFGSIQHRKMLSILQKLATSLLPGDFKVQAWDVKRGRRVVKLFECKQMSFPTYWELGKQRKLQMENALPILKHIRDHVHRLGTTIGKERYKICHGIPQGMHLSAILCEIYYNSLDREHLQKFLKTARDELYLRYCDDYLFLTPNKARAKEFLEKISHGFPDFTVTFNSQKSISNVDCEELYYVPFCGLYLNLDIFSVCGNFDAYEGQKISSSLSLRKTQKLGRVLFSRMRLVLKLTPVMIDPRINSKQGVAKNIYNAGLFMAFRFCAYVKALFPLKKMNTKFLVECLKRGEKAIKSKVVKALVSCGQAGFFTRPEIKLLVYYAFSARMKKSSSWCWRVLLFIRVTCDKILKTLAPEVARILLDVTKAPLSRPFSSFQ